MARASKTSQLAYDAAKILYNLRSDASPASFGLLTQVLFAHVLGRLGARLEDIRNPGHPDIIAQLGGRLYNIEVEVVGRTRVTQLEPADLAVLLNRQEGEYGFFCMLDCGPPIAWVCVDAAALGIRIKGKLRLSLLRAYSDKSYSRDCTEVFSKLVVENARHLPELKYRRLRRMAMQGRFI